MLRKGQGAEEAETWIRLENGAVLHQSKNPSFAAGRQTVCEPGALPRQASHSACIAHRSLDASRGGN